MKMLSLMAFAAALVASSTAMAGGPFPTATKPNINVQIIGTKGSGSNTVTSGQTGTANFVGIGMVGGKNDATVTQKGQFNAAYVGQVGKSNNVTLQQQGSRLNYGQVFQRQF